MTVLEGDLADLPPLTERFDVVIHSASSVSFDAAIDEAFATNVGGVERLYAALSEAQQSPHRSVICIPIFSNRGQTFGVVYLASKYAFSPNVVTMLTLLCQQASIGISNALLFRSVQAGTKENLKMISAQRDALEAARKSREDALKATKVSKRGLCFLMLSRAKAG